MNVVLRFQVDQSAVLGQFSNQGIDLLVIAGVAFEVSESKPYAVTRSCQIATALRPRLSPVRWFTGTAHTRLRTDSAGRVAAAVCPEKAGYSRWPPRAHWPFLR